MKIALFAIAAAALSPAAVAFDNADCATFLIGTWEQPTDDALTMTLRPNGTGSYTGHDVDLEITTWQAGPGTAASTCTLTTQTDAHPSPYVDTLTVIGPNTLESPRDGRFIRKP